MLHSSHKRMSFMQNRDFLKRRTAMFQAFSEERLQQIVEGSRAVSFETSQVIAHHGEQATHFGVVLTGTLTAYLPGNGHSPELLGELKAGETFGEAALMTGNPLLADVVAATPCEVLLVPVSLFHSIIVSEPDAVQHISRVIAERMKVGHGRSRQSRRSPSQSGGPLRSEAQRGTAGKDPGHQLRLVVPQIQFLRHGRSSPPRARCRGTHRIDGTRLKHDGPNGELKRELPKGDFGDAFKAMVTDLPPRRQVSLRAQVRSASWLIGSCMAARNSPKERSSPMMCWRRSRR